jgi:hypothetical protein
MKRIVIILFFFIFASHAFAEYKIEMVNGDPIIVQWYKLDKEKEVVVYQKQGKVSELPAVDVVNITPVNPVVQNEDDEDDSAPPAVKVEIIIPGLVEPPPPFPEREEEQRLDEKRRNEEWRIRQKRENRQRKEAYEKRRREHERKQAAYKRKNCNRRKKSARRDMERYELKLERAEDYLTTVRRESYSASSASSHKKRVQRARDKVEILKQQYEEAREEAYESCP